MSNLSLPDSLSLVGKTALVTGGSRGIGASIAILLATRGADVHVHYGKSREGADEVVAAIEKLGRKADAIQADLSTKDCGKLIFEGVEKSSFGGGRIDILVHNGAVSFNKELSEIDIDVDYTLQMDINVRSVIILTQASLPYLNQGSRIIMISSVSARGGFIQQTVYGGSKAMLESMAKTWSKELGQKYNATVNCVAPGPVETNMWNAVDEEFRNAIGVENTPAAARIGSCGDISEVVGFLASDSARWITGSCVSTSGGMLPV